jgi:3-oxoacyl-[acyl-carrier protein] reductase
MSNLLEGHIAVVTGGGAGIGRAIALGYAREGAEVVVLDAAGDAAAGTVDAIAAAGGKSRSFVLDVTDRNRCRALAAKIGETVGPISILVNNAGITRRNPITADPETVIQD